MDTKDIIVETCKSKGIPISRMERELGFSNGYISHSTGRKLPVDRVRRIAAYLKIPTHYLMYGEELPAGYYSDSRTAELAEELAKNPKMHMLFDAVRDIKEEDLVMVTDLVLRLKETNSEG